MGRLFYLCFLLVEVGRYGPQWLRLVQSAALDEKSVGKFCGGERSTDQVALNDVAAQGSQLPVLGLRFDTFGYDAE